MPPAIAAAGIGLAGSIGSGLIASSGAKKAANIQSKADQAAIAEQQRQFNVTDSELAPFRQAGLGGLAGYGDLVGTNGGPQQQAAINALQASPFYQSLYRNGMEATAQNAAATGGIRGGNAQTSFANFGADTLAQVIQSQLGNLGGLAQLGLGATNSTGAFGAAASNNIANLTTASGQAQSDAALAKAGALSGIFKNIGAFGSMALGIPGNSIGNNGSGAINVNQAGNSAAVARAFGGF